MLSIAECRKKLGGGDDLSDEAVEQLRNDMYDLAQFVAAEFDLRTEGVSFEGFGEDERRALLSFDGGEDH